MTTFAKENFHFSGGYLTYHVIPSDRPRFVARFKYQRGDCGPFMTFLRNNFTIEEYFSAVDGGESPLKILEAKGFVLPRIKKLLKAAGYPQTVEGFSAYINDAAARRAAA